MHFPIHCTVKKILILILLMFGVQSLWASLKPQSATFLTLADIHFDPFLACANQPKPCATLQALRAANVQTWDTIFNKLPIPVAVYKEDANYPLLITTLNELKKVNQEMHPQFVIVLGDFLAHSFRAKYITYSHDKTTAGYTQFVNKTLTFLTYKLNQVFPQTNVYPVIGNNDSYTGDYSVIPQGTFLRDTAETWKFFIKDTQAQADFLKEFPKAGYYSITLPPNKKILVLDTVLFSAKMYKHDMATAAQEQMNWLQMQLAEAQKNQTQILIAMHIPMGVDVYTTIRLYFLTIEEFWQPDYTSQFEALLDQYRSNVTAVLAGHIHMDALQIIPISNIPVIFTPAISPIFGNNPGFKIFIYQPDTLKLENYITYFYPDSGLPNTQWQTEYNFNLVYQPHCYKNCEMINGIRKLQHNNELAAYYRRYFAVGQLNSQPITETHDWNPYYWCAVNHVDLKGYRACLREA